MNTMLRKAVGAVFMQQAGEGDAGGGSAGGTESKRKSIKTVDSEALAKGIYHAKFSDGTEVVCAIDSIPQEHKDAMVAKFLAYGLKQKLDDSMAGADGIKEAAEELQSTWDSIMQGGWTTRVPGEGVEGGLFARAYSQRHGISLADAKAKIGSLVEKNFAANVEKNRGKKDAPEITERAVYNRIRDVALERDPELAAIHKDLKEKKAKRKTSKADMDIEL